tara:strand:+ start:2480 stop:2734 length:255 start_codon:yes stop_codon:yes gene_type:complete
MLNNSAYEFGVKLGKKAYLKNKFFYQDIYETLETEDDALEVMLNCWLAEELMIYLFYSDLDITALREGWSNGFLDSLFPLREYC